MKTLTHKNEYYRKTIHLSSLWIPLFIYTQDKIFCATFLLCLCALDFIIEYLSFCHTGHIDHLIKKSLIKTMRYKEIQKESFHLSGAFYVLVSAFCCTIVFSKEIACLSLCVMIISDASAAILGKYYGKIKIAPLQKIGEDARLVPYWQNNKNNLFVIIIGETARAANFSLYGYERQTDKELLPFSQDLYVYQQATSCGTATAVSLPCIFAPENRREFSVRKNYNRENLLDILQKSGYDVLWRENNSGCKGICNRIKTEILSKNYENPDEILLQNFSTQLKPQNQVIVLHQQGSHGPTYYRLYPQEFGIYRPYCTKKDFGECSQEEIINAYDNSIAYTSHIIAETIKQLEKLTDTYNVALLYVSDHGESLGEDGIYLHSAPYALAPKEQTHIPFMLWLPQKSIQALNINQEHLKSTLTHPVSHDNVFHTILGLAGIQTSLYAPEYDLLSSSQK